MESLESIESSTATSSRHASGSSPGGAACSVPAEREPVARKRRRFAAVAREVNAGVSERRSPSEAAQGGSAAASMLAPSAGSSATAHESPDSSALELLSEAVLKQEQMITVMQLQIQALSARNAQLEELRRETLDDISRGRQTESVLAMALLVAQSSQTSDIAAGADLRVSLPSRRTLKRSRDESEADVVELGAAPSCLAEDDLIAACAECQVGSPSEAASFARFLRQHRDVACVAKLEFGCSPRSKPSGTPVEFWDVILPSLVGSLFRSLVDLDLSRTQIRDDQVHFDASLGLRRLGLADCPRLTVAVLPSLMPLRHTLTQLDVSAIGITGPSAAALAPLVCLRRLKRLRLARCGPALTDACVAPLAGIPMLELLDVTGTHISEQAAADLRRDKVGLSLLHDS